MLSGVTDAQAHDGLCLDLDQLVREGARQMLAAALEAEVDAYLAAHAVERDEGGRRLVVRNGHARQREVTTAAGAVPVRAPRVDDRRVDPVTGERIRFRSVILPPWCRKSPKVAEVLPLLYLHGLSTGDFVPALAAFFGSAAGLSAAVITRLVAAWQADHEAFSRRDLTDRDYVYVWADGVHFRVRLDQARLCCLVIVGVRADGTKELVAVADGERESTDSWAEVLRDLRRRGMQAPVVAVGDGVLGLWAALRDVFPETRQQRDWVHKLANVLGCLPKAVQAGARKALVEIRDAPRAPASSRFVMIRPVQTTRPRSGEHCCFCNRQGRMVVPNDPDIGPITRERRGPGDAPDRPHAQLAIEVFARDYGVKWPKAVAKIADDAEALLCFFDFPAEHWVHLKRFAV
jgi:putative transposase